MFRRKSIWLPDQERKAQIAGTPDRAPVTFFGYQRIHEDEKGKRVISHFNTVARRYDLMNTILSFGIHYLWKRTAVKMLKLKPGDRVIDLCGGTGDLAMAAGRSIGPTGEMVLYDINREMMIAGRDRVLSSPFGKQTFYVQGDAEMIAFPDSSFDAAMVGFGIRNLTHVEKGFKEMYRVLKTGGKMMCLEFSKPSAPIFRWLYDLYSFYIMPFLGGLVVGSKEAYRHLPESIRVFPLPEELTRLLENIGFHGVTHRKLTNGIAVVHLGEK